MANIHNGCQKKKKTQKTTTNSHEKCLCSFLKNKVILKMSLKRKWEKVKVHPPFMSGNHGKNRKKMIHFIDPLYMDGQKPLSCRRKKSLAKIIPFHANSVELQSNRQLLLSQVNAVRTFCDYEKTTLPYSYCGIYRKERRV